uniref:Small ribosomal subunit protein uS17c n=1 Tax=Harveyella mirabilis TaxID=282355 RepID=A0A3S8UVY8_9FLOR|nr:ribosomal protein S17 [Harveyella mirabilis]
MSKKSISGIIISDKMHKTAVIMITKLVLHKKYKKIIKKTNKFYVDNPLNKHKVGDIVKIVQTRPLSKNKHWKIN